MKQGVWERGCVCSGVGACGVPKNVVEGEMVVDGGVCMNVV